MDLNCERATIYQNTPVTARKEHQCDACDETIAPRSRYHRIKILFDGSWDTILRCVRCEEIHAHLVSLLKDYDEWPNDRLNCGHTYEEMHGEGPPEDIAALAFALPSDRIKEP